jgi:hypothetical protein
VICHIGVLGTTICACAIEAITRQKAAANPKIAMILFVSFMVKTSFFMVLLFLIQDYSEVTPPFILPLPIIILMDLTLSV